MWCALSVIKLKNKILYRRAALITIQKTVRMFLARKQHAPRYKGIMKLKTLESQIQQIGNMSQSLKKDKESVMKSVKTLEKCLRDEMAKIKANPKMKESDIKRTYDNLLGMIKKELGNVKKKIEDQKIKADRKLRQREN